MSFNLDPSKQTQEIIYDALRDFVSVTFWRLYDR